MADSIETGDGGIPAPGGRDGVVVLRISNPPSGAVTADMRAALGAGLDAALRDPDCRAIVIAGEDAAFAVGTGLEAGAVGDAPSLADLCDAIEASEKPVVAAITGPALGNGLEIALAAHARVARADGRLGAPEITIGLVPGAGATQRLPRVVGGLAALKMLLSGRSVTGASALRLGLVDRLAEGDVIAAATELALGLAESGVPLARSSERRDRLGEGAAFLEAVSEHRRIAAASPLDAPLRMIECVEAALLLPYEIGRGLESAAFEDLVRSDHSRALRHVFALERRLTTATERADRTPSRPMATIGMVGARGVGSEIAVACLDAGFSVVVAEQSDEALEAGVTRIIEQFDARVAAGKMKEDAVETTLERLNAVCGFTALGEADVVIDPGPGIARRTVAALDAAMRAGAVLATGSSQVAVGTMAAATRRPSDIVGFRLFPGMRANRMAELQPGPETSPRALATVRALARKLDRLVVTCGPGPAGIGQRIGEALHAAADLCVEEGASIVQVDAVLEDWGLPHGSFAWRDMLGLGHAPRQGVAPDIGALLAADGRTGRGSGRGFYLYRQRGRKGVEDPDVTAFVAALRRKAGIRPRELSDGEIRLRCVAAMAGEGARMIEDGTAESPSDIDMVAIHGLGFARRTGGVMFAADLVGLAEVRDKIADLATRTRRIATPSRIFDDLIRVGSGFAALDF